LHEEAGLHIRLRLRGLVEGEAEAPVLARLTPISFYGEVDPDTGALHGTGETIAGKILVTSGTRGSTVGPYILYALAKAGKKPAAIVVEQAEPLLVAGAVMAETPLAEGLPRSVIEKLEKKPPGACRAKLASQPPHATLEIQCP
jgi:predicted aconitase with swiveling domain